MVSRGSLLGPCLPVNRPVGQRGRPAPPRRDYATTMRIRILLGTTLSVVIIACAVLISWASDVPAGLPVRLVASSSPHLLDFEQAQAVALPIQKESTGTAPARSSAPKVDPSYVRAARICPGLDPAVLAAIHTIETRQGRDRRVSSAGAVGPMQFLPATWAHYGMDGNGDGRADIRNFSDAVFSAASYLCANGGADPKQLPSAIWNYNHSHEYVSAVLRLARSLKAE